MDRTNRDPDFREWLRSQVAAVQREGADHLSNDAAIAPRPGQPFTELSEMQMQQAAEEEPVMPSQPINLDPVGAGRWRFRTVPPIGSFQIRLDIPVESEDRDENIRRTNRMKQWTQRQVDQGRFARGEVGKDGILKADRAVFAAIGRYTLVFTPVRTKSNLRAMEAEFVTEQKIIADYIRGRLTRGDFAGEVYEDVQPIEIEINGQQVLVAPANETARLAMAAAAAG